MRSVMTGERETVWAAKPCNPVHSPLWRLAVFVSLVVFVICGVSDVDAATVAANDSLVPRSNDEWHIGFDLFHLMLQKKQLKTEVNPAAIMQDPRRAVIVSVGELNATQMSRDLPLAKFVERGGALLIASDRSQSVRGLGTFHGGPVTVSVLDAYRDFRDCPRVAWLEHAHPLMADVTELVANRSGWWQDKPHRLGLWQDIAILPTADPKRSAMPRRATLCAVLASSEMRGRVVAIADHSLLINGMLWHGDNGQFVLNLTTWLTQDDRTNLLFLIDGQPVQLSETPGQGQVAIPSELISELPPIDPDKLPPINPEDLPPIKLSDLKRLPPETWLPFGNALLATMEDADLHNELAAERPRSVRDFLYRRFLYLVAAIAGCIYWIRQLLRRHRQEQPPLTPQPTSWLASRSDTVIRMGEYLPTAQLLTGELFHRLTGTSEPPEWHRFRNALHIDGSIWLRWRVRRVLNQLLNIAAQRHRRSLNKRRFLRVMRKMNMIDQLHQSGQLQRLGKEAIA